MYLYFLKPHILSVALFLSIGFTSQAMSRLELTESQQSRNVNLKKTKGKIPVWLRGSFIRIGPAKFTLKHQTISHWFDGLGMLYKFEFMDNKVFFTNAFVKSDVYLDALKEGILISSFDEKPVHSNAMGQDKTTNANIHTALIKNTGVALGETERPVAFSPQTLETMGAFIFEDDLPVQNVHELAHMKKDPKTGAYYNLVTSFGWFTYYNLYRVDPGTKERKLITKIYIDRPSYMHDFSITDKHLILIAPPLKVNPSDLKKMEKPFIENYQWDPQSPTTIYVVDRETGDLVFEGSCPPFFTFHHINAYEKEGLLHLHFINYPDAKILQTVKDLSHKDLYQTDELGTPSEIIINLNKKEMNYNQNFLGLRGVEFPRLNETLIGLPYTVFYGTDFSDRTRYVGLIKYNLQTRQKKEWHKPEHFAGEPIFVKNPGETGEDEGVLMTEVYNRKKKESYLLILDAKSLKELATFKIPYPIPPSLHGNFWP